MTLGRSKAAQSRKADIQFHSDGYGRAMHAAVCVKVRSMPNVEAPETILQRAYDQTVEEFWNIAGGMAREHAYSGVFPEGRSDGWLIPYTQHDRSGKLVTDWTGQGPDKGYPVYPNVKDAGERRRFLKFRAAIEGLLRDAQDWYGNNAAGLLEKDEAEKTTLSIGA